MTPRDAGANESGRATAAANGGDSPRSRADEAGPIGSGETGSAEIAVEMDAILAPAIETTPERWRLAAAGILAGGILAGFAASRGRLGRSLPVLTAGVALGAVLPIVRASRRPPIRPEDAASALARIEVPPTFSVVVAARDEAAVLTQLVRDVSAQDYRDLDGRPHFELIVVDDRSTDGSASAVRRAADACGVGGVTRIIRREGAGLADGKGAALTAAPPQVCRGDVILVLDADARVDPSFLRRAAGYFAAGCGALTARRRIIDAGSSFLAGAQNDEQTADGELQRGRWASGGCSEFRGNGIMVRRDLLTRAGGWRASALTEDIDLSSRVAAVSGERVAWAIDAEVWEEPVRSLGGLWRQRLRWAEGAFRRAFEHGPAVLRSPHLPAAAKLDFATYVGQLLVPPVVAGAALGAATGGRRRVVAWILGGYVGVSGLLGWDSLRWERGADGSALRVPERLGRSLRLSLFSGLWLFTVPGALWNLARRRGAVRYVKMEHLGSDGASTASGAPMTSGAWMAAGPPPGLADDAAMARPAVPAGTPQPPS